ncbi:MAG TPA: sugar phosphate isomerase/epimerase family protein [Candidatus Limnocylindrales bacterium]|nr:sugar phosphate isomerase/epimerase family protein [Candidatus Limnocylindrales bacterium]
MFKYAVSNWIYGDEKLDDTYKRLNQAGYHGIELVGEPERYDPAEIIKLNSVYDVAVISVLSWCLWPPEDRDLAHINDGMRRKAVDYVCKNVDLAEAVGASMVVVIPAPSGRPVPHRAPAEAGEWQLAAREEWNLAVDSVQRIAHYAQNKNIIIAVEPINRFETFLLNSTAQGLQFIEEVGLPNVRLHLDTFHMNIEDADMSKAVEKAGPLLVNMHLSDSNRCAVGRGHINFKALIEALVKIEYQGAFVLEPLPLHPNPFVAGKLPEFRSLWERDLAESIVILRDLEQQVLKEKEV